MNFATVEKNAVLAGCEDFLTEEGKRKCFHQKIMEHIAQNFVYPTKAKKLGVQGRVFVNFVVERNGEVSNVEIVRGLQDPKNSSKVNAAAKEIEKECIRVIRLLPPFSPAINDGKPVRMQFTMPINAKIQ